MNIQDWPLIDKQKLSDHLRWNSYLSRRHKLLYISTPKVACTSLKWWFASLEGYSEALYSITDSEETDPDLVAHEAHKVAPQVTNLAFGQLAEALTSDGYFRFAVVRNPYKRIFSAWQSKLLLREPLQIGPYTKYAFYQLPIESARDIAAGFEGFLEHLASSEAPSYLDHHWAPQATLLRPDLIDYTKLTKIEETGELRKALMEWLGEKAPDPFSVRRANESLIPYSPALVTERSVEIIRALYAEDFDAFGYERHPPSTPEGFSDEQLDVALKAVKLIRARHQRLGERAVQVANLNRDVNRQEARVAEIVKEKDRALAAVADEKDRVLGALRQERDQMLRSRSWRITKPLRGIARVVHRSQSSRLVLPLRQLRRRITHVVSMFHAVRPAVEFYQGSWRLAGRRVAGVFRREGIGGVIRRAHILTGRSIAGDEGVSSPGTLYGEVRPLSSEFTPRVSIIVPNFNHAGYLRKRLESIYSQTYSNLEVILLDDCSNDESVAILKDYATRYPDKTICHFNEINSGGVFNQWKKGLELATGELVWIAESDDYCSDNFLEELVRCFQNKAVKLAFAQTEFVRGNPPEKVWTSKEYLQDLGEGAWSRPFIRSAHSMVKFGWAVKNIVPNVSGAVFRHPGKLPLFEDPQWLSLRLCGDWIFYLSIVRGGLVAYNPRAINYYRQHASNTSVGAQKEDIYYREHEVVARYVATMYRVDRSDLDKQQRHLYVHWCSQRGASRRSEFKQLYDLDRVWPRAADRRPNVVMAVYALAAGGGETFPILLANLLERRGYAVTLLNCQEEATEPGVRTMLSQSIPLLELERLELAPAVFADMGIELVHSHHAWVDVSLAMLLLSRPGIKQIISMHGMYEMMEPGQLDGLLPLLWRRVDRFVYTADKNLKAFPPEMIRKKGFRKIDNALPVNDINPASRADLRIAAEDFVLCLVARAIPDKGWEEAIGAVVWANERSDCRIRLLLIGEGPEFDRLKSECKHEFVHFLGFQPNIRDYFAASDIGFLPSRFKGESAPLVLIDCLLSGKPVLASNVGEIRDMLDTPEGVAGALFDLSEWEVDVPALGDLIVAIANDPMLYEELLKRVPLAAAKFAVSTMLEKYEEVYRDVLTASETVPRTLQ
ncbi:glycosyltransferase [Rhizobium sp. LjRoot258]|uniref:glycosyltransferase n=1 Tax=Rhizobium sp. LjRoot258 TaxID=3342299 RepID=UPI003ECF33DA